MSIFNGTDPDGTCKFIHSCELEEESEDDLEYEIIQEERMPRPGIPFVLVVALIKLLTMKSD